MWLDLHKSKIKLTGIFVILKNVAYFTQNTSSMAAITLRTIPDEVHQYLLDIQGKTKSEKRVSQYSLEQTVYKIIKEHKELFKRKNSASKT